MKGALEWAEQRIYAQRYWLTTAVVVIVMQVVVMVARSGTVVVDLCWVVVYCKL